MFVKAAPFAIRFELYMYKCTFYTVEAPYKN